MTTRLFGAAVAVLLVFAGCGGGDDAERNSPQPAAADEHGDAHSFGAEEISLASSLAQVRGHHRVALELYTADDVEGAAIHAGHPVDELLPALSGEVDEHGGDAAALEASVVAVQDTVADGGSTAPVREAVDDAAAETDAALDALVEEPDDPAFVGSVVAALLGTAAHEYEEAVGAEGIELVDEYQDGYAFLLEAQDIYDTIRADVESAEPEEAEEIDDAFAILANAFPSVAPPEDPVAAEDVEAAAALIGHELEEVVGAQLAEESDPEEIVAHIEELLDEIEAAYAAGDTAEASELAAEAYLENYEVIEADVIELAPEINEELEPLLGAELRRQMDEGASEDEINDMIAQAKELLQEALAAIEGAE